VSDTIQLQTESEAPRQPFESRPPGSDVDEAKRRRFLETLAGTRSLVYLQAEDFHPQEHALYLEEVRRSLDALLRAVFADDAPGTEVSKRIDTYEAAIRWVTAITRVQDLCTSRSDLMRWVRSVRDGHVWAGRSRAHKSDLTDESEEDRAGKEAEELLKTDPNDSSIARKLLKDAEKVGQPYKSKFSTVRKWIAKARKK
jgi:hypothetical protein